MIEIKRNGTVFYEIEELCEGSKLSYQLMEHHYVTLKFSTAEPVYFQVGDYVELPDFGYFELTSAYFPTHNATNGGYDYEMQMDAYYVSWKNKLLKYRPQYGANETSFKLTTSVSVHLNVILTNLKALGYKYNGKDFTVNYTSYNNDVFDTEERFYIEYDSVSIYDALTSIADKLECEWWVDGSVIYLGYCETAGQVTFEQGVNMFSMSQSESKSDYVTRLYAFGSDRNIPDGYFTGLEADVTTDGIATDYLMLPNQEQDEEGFVAKDGYLENVNVVTNDKQAIEGIVRFEDEYPKVECSVSEIKTYDSTVNNDDGTTTTQTFWQITSADSFVTKFSSSWIKKNVNISIKFTSGSLLGMEFEAKYRVMDGKNFFDVVANDTYGRTLPDSAMCPKVADDFFLYNWDATKITETDLIKEAQASLLERAKTYYRKSMIDNSNFTCVLDGEKFYNDGIYNYHPLGEQVKLINPMFSDVDADGKHYRNSRIIGMEINLDIPYDSPTYTVGEKASYSRLGQLETTVNSIVVNGIEVGGTGNGSGVYVIGTNDATPATDSNVYSARRTGQTFLRKDVSDTAKGKITFEQGLSVGTAENGGIDAEGNAALKRIEVGDMITSADFVDGFTGEGGRVWEEDGLVFLTLDKLTVRQTMNVMELLINKIRSVGGQICVSAANGKVKSVTKSNSGLYYLLTFEDENPFLLGDLVRCQTFTGGKVKSYWVEVGAVSTVGIQVKASEFSEGNEPAAGDECVLMGSTSNRNRQNLVLISAAEDGKPRVDVLNGVSGKDFDGALRARLGNLDGIESSAFPDTLQPQGDGLFADNAYLKGTFVLSTGEDVKTRFEITDEGVKSQVESIRDDVQTEGNHLSNPSFRNDLDGWSVGVTSTAFSVSENYIWANDNILTRNGSSVLTEDDGRKVVMIKAMYLRQLNESMKNTPDTSADNKPVGVTLSFRYRCISEGTLTAQLVSENGDVLNVTRELAVTDGYETFAVTGVWAGTEDLEIAFTGEMYVAMLCLRTDNGETLAYRYGTLFQQTDRLVNIAAQYFDEDGNVKAGSGIVVTNDLTDYVTTKDAQTTLGNYVTNATAVSMLNGYVKTEAFAGLFADAVDDQGVVKKAALSAYVTKDEDGNLESDVYVHADQITLEGLVTANENFKVLEDGSMEAANGKFTGEITTTKGKIGGFTVSGTAITASGAYAGQGVDTSSSRFFLHSAGDGFLCFSDANKWAGIGLNTTGTGSYTLLTLQDLAAQLAEKYGAWINVQNSEYKNVGAYINTSGGEFNYALLGQGDVVTKGCVVGTALAVFEPSKTNGYNISLCSLQSTTVMLKPSTTSTVYLPTEEDVRTYLCLDETDTFAVRLTLVNESAYNIYVSGSTIGAHKTAEWLLTYDGSTYKTYNL